MKDKWQEKLEQERKRGVEKRAEQVKALHPQQQTAEWLEAQQRNLQERELLLQLQADMVNLQGRILVLAKRLGVPLSEMISPVRPFSSTFP